MYHAKIQKLGTTIYNAELSGRSDDRLHLLADFRESLKNNHIKVHYQPIVNMQTHALHVEALARWHHPPHGNITPNIFIPLAEETGNSHKLTSKIMKSAMRACAGALNEHQIENLSINISTYCLSNPKFPAEIKAYLQKYAIKAESLTLEITESAMMSNSPATQKTIGALHAAGIGFSIDDFGTGYSSLSKLKLIPLRELKIDRSLISDINQCKNDSAITNAAIQMAHGLRLTVVAEGIEVVFPKNGETSIK